MLKNEDTFLIETKEYGYHGVGFVTKIDGIRYRCAVKLPLNASGKQWGKAWDILMEALKNPTKYTHVKGNLFLTGNEIELEDTDDEIDERARIFLENCKEDAKVISKALELMNKKRL